MKFLEVNNMYINLDHVVSIKFEESKVIFNYDYEISLNGRGVSPDYTYIDLDEYEKREIKDKIMRLNFITFEKSDNSKTFVNLNNVSSIKEYVRPYQQRLIFNTCVSNSVQNKNIITSNAVYYDFNTEEDFNEALSILDSNLNKGE